jgi:hypothetical protein
VSVTENQEARPDFYILGGALQPSAKSYVPREADSALLAAIRNRQFCYVLTPRQMGKSSLMVRAAKQLRAEGSEAVVIDLTQIGSGVTAEQWYLGHLKRVHKDLSLSTDYLTWWKQNGHLGLVQRFSAFLEEVALNETVSSIAIFIDEIDTTLNLSYSDDYFAAIRALYNRRAANPDLERLTFVLLGVASPSDLIKDSTRTPFNVGTRIRLTDFDAREATPLIAGLAPDRRAATALLKQVLFWTGGHPYLTQQTCHKVAEWARSKRWSPSSVPLVVDDLVKELFFTEAGRNTDPNLQFVRDQILEHPDRGRLLRMYLAVRRGELINDDELDPIRSTLKLSGLVKVTDGGLLKVRNLIYEHVFDDVWVAEAGTHAASDKQRKESRGILDRLLGRDAEPKYEFDVFVSYSQRDRDWVNGFLIPSLENAGLSVFQPEHQFPPGEPIWRALQRAMTATRNFLVVVSPAYLASSAAELEMNTAVRLASESPDRRVIPILLRKTDLPLLISGLTYVDFTQHEQSEDATQRLLRGLGRTARSGPEVHPMPITSTKYDTSAIRAMLDALDSDDLTALAYDYFREVYDKFNPNTSKKVKLQRIIEFAEQRDLFDRLLDYMARTHPHEYRRYGPRL